MCGGNTVLRNMSGPTGVKFAQSASATNMREVTGPPSLFGVLRLSCIRRRPSTYVARSYESKRRLFAKPAAHSADLSAVFSKTGGTAFSPIRTALAVNELAFPKIEPEKTTLE